MPRGSNKGEKRGPYKTTTKKVLKIAAEAESIVESGELPHEWLLKIARGDCIKQMKVAIEVYKTGSNKGKEKARKWIEVDYYPDFNERVDAAKSAAPFYAPRLATQTVKLGDNTAEAMVGALKAVADKLPV